ncbi:40S ribosomal protein S2, partial [Galemys pyrenaicus]
GLQSTQPLGCLVCQRGSCCHVRGTILAKPPSSWCSEAAGTMQALHCPLQGDQPLRRSAANLILTHRFTGVVMVPEPKKQLLLSSINDYTQGCTVALHDLTKAIFDTISNTYSYLTPNLWGGSVFTKSPYEKLIDCLVKIHITGCAEGPGSSSSHHRIFVSE